MLEKLAWGSECGCDDSSTTKLTPQSFCRRVDEPQGRTTCGVYFIFFAIYTILCLNQQQTIISLYTLGLVVQRPAQ